MKTYTHLFSTLAFVAAAMFSSASMAVPVLQLGPGDTSDPSWSYDTVDETWIYSGTTNDTSLSAYALKDAFKDCSSSSGGCSGHTSSNTVDRIAYLAVAATPKTSDATKVFDVSVTNNGNALSMVDSGHGAPPVSDTNLLDNTHHDLSSHGIYDTYYEVYKFKFDESVHHVPNTVSGNHSNKDGWLELINISVNWTDPAVSGLHFDLYTLDCDGTVYKFAPYSHDAGMEIPEPTPLVLTGLGLILASVFGARRVKSGRAV